MAIRRKPSGQSPRITFTQRTRTQNFGGRTLGGDEKRRLNYGGSHEVSARAGGRAELGRQPYVGSSSVIENFDGSVEYFEGDSASGFGGAGGGSGSSTQGLESKGLVGDTQGQSMDEIVYGVRKKNKKIRRPRSL